MKQFIKIAASLRLTLGLMVCAMLLVFFGTLDQVEYGVYEVQQRYFSSWIAFWRYPGSSWFGVPMPGGILLGIVFLINLIFAGKKHFVVRSKKIGIGMIHGGITLLVISGFLTYWFQDETQMWIKEGGSSNYSKSSRNNEFVIIDKSNDELDRVFSVNSKNLKPKDKLYLTGSPFSIEFIDLYENADIGMGVQNPDHEPSFATHGAGKKMGLVVFPQKPSFKDEEPNAVTGHVRVSAGSQIIGTWLVSNIFDDRFPPQKFTYDGKDYEIALRFKRTYFDFGLKLNKFTHEVHPGTEIPSDFSSDVTIVHSDASKPERDVLIYMNNPLRMAGYTFFQASFVPGGNESMLQVVRNPSRLLPYGSVILVGLGLVVHFVIVMLGSQKRRQAKEGSR